MASSTGPLIAVGVITVANKNVFHNEPWDWRVPTATALAAAVFAIAESIIGPSIPRGIAMVALVAVTLGRVDPNVPSPVESALSWWQTSK